MQLHMGGDDFIAKPIDLGVMTSKIQAILRRAYDMGTRIPVYSRNIILNIPIKTKNTSTTDKFCRT